MNSEYFVFDGINSSELGVYLVNVESGLLTHKFLAEKEIISETIQGNDMPYVYGNTKRPLVINITLSTLDGKWTFEKRRELARLLDVDYFAKFYRADEQSKIYYLQYIGGIDLTHNACENGYLTMQMQNISAYTYSPVYIETILHDGVTPEIYNFTNNGDANLYPEMSITKIGDGDLSIVNLSNGGKEFKFTGLLDNEILTVDNLNHDIETDVPLTTRYDNFNNEYLELPRGVNRLEVSSPCEITFRYQFTIKG